MTHPPPNLVELARRIVEQEAGGASDPAASAAAAESACRRLKDHLIALLGSGGVAALLGRALHLAQRERAPLAGVSMSAEPAVCFSGLAESLTACTQEDAAAAASTLIMHVLELLVMLLGEELGMKPIRKLWPHATSAREIQE